jgi:hypothetical protein
MEHLEFLRLQVGQAAVVALVEQLQAIPNTCDFAFLFPAPGVDPLKPRGQMEQMLIAGFVDLDDALIALMA